ncbi:3-isopropylmalate dehydratase small subunit 1-like [Mangifera indica]|uniref:3-isopropylmalate dehydratase small subunit 1-like n=1 Tax=Mangifera indica TaxID=29780 RepID=UPI001CFBCF89|nr:3-isopropylmalate dehydratase small subunit 1-like [Mangifera indica]
MAASSLSFSAKTFTFSPAPKTQAKPFINHFSNSLRFPTASSTSPAIFTTSTTSKDPRASSVMSRATNDAVKANTNTFHSLCYVVGNNIDTDQIISADYLTLAPSKPEEYEKLGSYALIGLPSTYTMRLIGENETKTKYKIVIENNNFRCESSREHAPVALGAAGVTVAAA